MEWSPTQFHERLSVSSMDSIEEVEQYFTEHYDRLCGKYGVLLFMYTVMMTKVNRPVHRFRAYILL